MPLIIGLLGWGIVAMLIIGALTVGAHATRASRSAAAWATWVACVGGETVWCTSIQDMFGITREIATEVFAAVIRETPAIAGRLDKHGAVCIFDPFQPEPDLYGIDLEWAKHEAADLGIDVTQWVVKGDE